MNTNGIFNELFNDIINEAWERHREREAATRGQMLETPLGEHEHAQAMRLIRELAGVPGDQAMTDTRAYGEIQVLLKTRAMRRLTRDQDLLLSRFIRHHKKS